MGQQKRKPIVQLNIHKQQAKEGDVLLLFRCEELHLPRAKQQRKQTLQICLKWFDEADITVSRTLGLDIMQEVAAKYLNDKDDDALEQHRDDAIAQRGNSSRKARFPKKEKGDPRRRRPLGFEAQSEGPQKGSNAHRAGRVSGARAPPPKKASEDEKEHAAEGRGTP